MHVPKLTDTQLQAIQGMVSYWDEVDNRPKEEKIRIFNNEIHSLIHVLPAITILRIVADHIKNK